MRDNNWNNVELRDNRYNQIVHMVSAANGAEDFYSVEVSVFALILCLFFVSFLSKVKNGSSFS